MITHVKKNAQKTDFTKESYRVLYTPSIISCDNHIEHNKPQKLELLLPEEVLSSYLSQRERECRLYLFGGL
ncbi:MAG TPA: hypothetical protein VMC80_03160 [Patescibacteria group bacterium]|nr:hypothetical protein [Patescibacteria group bacterium]